MENIPAPKIQRSPLSLRKQMPSVPILRMNFFTAVSISSEGYSF